jgi:hypothetical protein
MSNINPSNRPGAIALYLLAGAGVTGLLMVVLVVYSGFRQPVRPALLDLVTVVSVVALFAGARGVVGVSRETKAWEADPARMGPVLARWTYARDEWEAYTEREYRVRRRGAWGFGAYTAVSGATAAVALATLAMSLGALATAWLAVIGWIAAAAAAVMFVAGVAVWRARVARLRRRNLALREPSAVIASRGVLVGGTRDYFCDRHTRTSAVHLVAAETPPVLEVTVVYPGGRVKQKYTTRVPVPRGREEEARGLVRVFEEGRWESGQAPRAEAAASA